MIIFIPPEIIVGKQHIKVPHEKSRYLTTVLRCKKGDAATVIDGKGRAYRAEIVSVAKNDVFITINEELFLNTEIAAPLILCQGMLKGEKMELVIQKATELGIAEIVPLVTGRSVVQKTRKLKRWHAIAEEAAEQCGRAVIPAVHEPVALNLWLASFDREKTNGLIFWEQGGLPVPEAIAHCPLPVTRILIGPEGGFTAEEVAHAEKSGLVRATLGKRILRAETAAIVATALVQAYREK